MDFWNSREEMRRWRSAWSPANGAGRDRGRMLNRHARDATVCDARSEPCRGGASRTAAAEITPRRQTNRGSDSNGLTAVTIVGGAIRSGWRKSQRQARSIRAAGRRAWGCNGRANHDGGGSFARQPSGRRNRGRAARLGRALCQICGSGVPGERPKFIA
jgi:hypothetical protein